MSLHNLIEVTFAYFFHNCVRILLQRNSSEACVSSVSWERITHLQSNLTPVLHPNYRLLSTRGNVPNSMHAKTSLSVCKSMSLFFVFLTLVVVALASTDIVFHLSIYINLYIRMWLIMHRHINYSNTNAIYWVLSA